MSSTTVKGGISSSSVPPAGVVTGTRVNNFGGMGTAGESACTILSLLHVVCSVIRVLYYLSTSVG